MFDELDDARDELPTTETSTAGGGSGAFRPSRRKVLAVAAWTVPVVIVGTAAPAFASSAAVFPSSWGSVCRHTNNLQPWYGVGTTHIAATWRNDLTSAVTVTITSVKIGTTTYTTGITARVGLFTVPSSSSFSLPATSTRSDVIIHIANGPSVSSAAVTVTYKVNGQTYTSGPAGTVSLPQCSTQLGG